MLAGLAAAPVAGLPAIAGVVAEDDPIIKALAEVRRAQAAYEREEEDDAQNDAFRAIGDAEFDLFSTEPSTLAGAAKLLRFIADFLDEDGVVNDNWVGDMIGPSIRNAVAVLEKGALS